jgi:elongation factor 1-beta
MGSVALILRVMPESPEVDLTMLTEQIRMKVPGLMDVREEPIGFGLKALKIAVIVGDSAGESIFIRPLFQGAPSGHWLFLEFFPQNAGIGRLHHDRS